MKRFWLTINLLCFSFLLSSCSEYEGDYVDGKKNGQGIMTWFNGNRYEGDF
ncbi:MAG: hypothetical protein KAR12_18890, partial [Methylococcales bacterium]|nr:hypothetical protein [Methylococcales bacterium]